MSTWWKVDGLGYAPRITPVEVVKETDKTVTIAGRDGAYLVRKRSDHYNHFATFDAAKEFALSHTLQQVGSARRQLELANSRHGNVKGMNPPPTKQGEQA